MVPEPDVPPAPVVPLPLMREPLRLGLPEVELALPDVPVRIPPWVEPVMSGLSLFLLQPAMPIPATTREAAANTVAIFFRMLTSWLARSSHRATGTATLSRRGLGQVSPGANVAPGRLRPAKVCGRCRGFVTPAARK